MSYGVDSMNEEKAYWTHEIASMLKVSDSTLRKWCIALEKQGYEFIKGKNKSRAFLVRDKNAFLYFKRLVQVEGRTIEEASKQVYREYFENNRTTPIRATESLVQGAFEEELESIEKRLAQQEELNRQILERLIEQERRQEERDKNLMMTLNQILETKKELAAVKQKKWWQFWK